MKISKIKGIILTIILIVIFSLMWFIFSSSIKIKPSKNNKALIFTLKSEIAQINIDTEKKQANSIKNIDIAFNQLNIVYEKLNRINNKTKKQIVKTQFKNSDSFDYSLKTFVDTINNDVEFLPMNNFNQISIDNQITKKVKKITIPKL